MYVEYGQQNKTDKKYSVGGMHVLTKNFLIAAFLTDESNNKKNPL